MPNISFVIPAYNASQTLEEAVNSIFDGNFENGDEVIIVDDHSTDTTSNVAERLAREYSPSIKVITNTENKGCPASRNVGIKHSRNSLIFNLDSDNVLAPGQIQILKKALLESCADAVAFHIQRYFKTTTDSVTHEWECKTGIFSLADLFSGIVNQGSGGNYLYTKKIWEKIGGYWEYGKGLHEAWGFTLKLLLGSAKFIVVPDTFYYHRYSHNSLFVRENEKKGEGTHISNKILSPAIPLLSPQSKEYITHHPDWLEHLSSHPLFLADGSQGSDGEIKYRTILGKIKKILKKLR